MGGHAVTADIFFPKETVLSSVANNLFVVVQMHFVNVPLCKDE